MLLDELSYEDVWKIVKQTPAESLKNSNISADALDLAENLEWPAKVQPKRISFDIKPSPIFHQLFLGGDRFGE